MGNSRRVMLAAGVALLGGTLVGVSEGTAQSGAGPVARYTMDVATTGNPMGGSTRELTLRLGSDRTAPTPKADHFMPAGALLGPSVPLVTPTRTVQQPVSSYAMNDGGQRPKGKLKIYWGCGAHAGPGQPYVLDFANAPATRMAAAFSTAVPVERSIGTTNARTIGEWPNSDGTREVKGNASLIGQHRVAGNYSPEISFALSQDFMPALRGQAGSAADGSMPLSWNAVAGATGYYAWAMGADPASGDMVWWVSSATREVGGGLTDWLSPATVARLVGQKVVMPGSQTSCTVPVEAKQAAGGMLMTQLFAYGPEQDVSYPPRPASAKAAWRPEWTMRARFRSSTTIMPGMPAMMEGMGGEAVAAAAGGQVAAVPKRKCKPRIGSLLGGMFGGGRPSLGGALGAAASGAAEAASCR